MLARGVMAVMVAAGLVAVLIVRGEVFYHEWLRARDEKVNDEWFIERCKSTDFSMHLVEVCKRVETRTQPWAVAFREATRCPSQIHLQPWLAAIALVPGILSLLEWVVWRMCGSRRVYKELIHKA